MSKFFLAGLLLLAVFRWGNPLAGARVVLAFVPAAAQASARATDPLTKEPEHVPESWGAPVDLARLLLESPGLTDAVCHFLESRPDPEKQKGLRGAFALQEEGKLVVRPLGASLLELDVLDPDPKMAQLYCQAVLAYLQEAIQEERRSKEVNSQLASDLLQADEQLLAQEALLTKNVAAPSAKSASHTTDLITLFAVNHYRENLAAKNLAQERQVHWVTSFESSSPHFLVISGPTAFRRSYRSAILGSVAVAGLAITLWLLVRGRK